MLEWLKYPLIDERAEPGVFDPKAAEPGLAQERGAAEPIAAGYGDREVGYAYHDGSKFYGGFGETQLLTADYWTLRARSVQLFETNLFARGLIRRIVTNKINTGLHLEATPIEKVLEREEDALADWSEQVETLFEIWGSDAWLCDNAELRTWGGLQEALEIEALVAGDVLIVLRQSQVTGLPRIQLISGGSIQNPYPVPKLRDGNRIEHGVELDGFGRHVAFWVRQEDGTSKRLPAWGEKSGRRLAWLVYGSDKRLDDVRGKPLLSLVLQSLREIDRYRDSTQRKAVINSMLAMFIKRTEDKPATAPITGAGATLRTTVQATAADGKPRTFNTSELIPGLVLDRLQQGEEPHGFQPHGTDEKYADFEEAIIQAVAWGNGVPPEILRLSFSSNYSASKAANNEFDITVNMWRAQRGDSVCTPIYQEWLLAAVLAGKIDAVGLLEAWRDATQYDRFAAWTRCDWTGQIKLAIDQVEAVESRDLMVKGGYMTRDRAARELTGTKFSQNIKKLARENKQLVEANKILLELEPKAAAPAPRQPTLAEREKNAPPPSNNKGKAA